MAQPTNELKITARAESLVIKGIIQFRGFGPLLFKEETALLTSNFKATN